MRIYNIIETSEISQVDFDQVLQTSSSSLKYSLDGSKAILKYEGETPSFLEGKTQYSLAEILAILATGDWTPEEGINS
jgi:citrate synthase